MSRFKASHVTRAAQPLLLAATVVASASAVRGATPQAAQHLNVLYRVKVNGTDYMTTTATSDLSYPSDGAIYYLPSASSDYYGTLPLYGLYYNKTTFPTFSDRMDSMSDSEVVDGKAYGSPTPPAPPTPLGYGFQSGTTLPGLSQLTRVSNTARDHATIRPGESLSGYTSSENLTRWGYARYGNSATSMLGLSAGGVSIESNRVAGGALWNWTWNGTQFLSNGHDYGRQIQTSMSFNYTDGTGTHNGCNPTEAGDGHSVIGTPAAQKHGAPLIYARNNGNTQSTRSVPLDFPTGAGAGGDADHPIAWSGFQMGKDVTLNYNNMGPVAKYETTVKSNLNLTYADNASGIQIPTVYLRPLFDTFYTYDAQSQAATLQNIASDSEISYAPASGYGGVIISEGTSSTDKAFGLYGVLTSHGGSVSSFDLTNYIILGNGDLSADAANCTNLGAKYLGDISEGTHTYTTWLMSDTLANVKSYMNTLYSSGVTGGISPPAGTIIWSGLTGYWTTDSNWDTGHAPTSSNPVRVDSDGSHNPGIAAGQSAAAQSLTVGYDTYNVGVLSMSGGSLSVTQGLVVGRGGSGTFDQTGGTVTSSYGGTLYTFTLGAKPGSTGVYNMSGASSVLNVSEYFDIGEAGTGAFNLNGGTVNADTTNFGNNGGGSFSGMGSGSLYLNGGTFTTEIVRRWSSSGTAGAGNLYFNGGTLKAASTTTVTDWVSNLTHAYVKAGGAIIDTNGKNVTISQALEEDSTSQGGGLIKNGSGVLTLGAVNTYKGTTTVNAGGIKLGNANAVQYSTVSVADIANPLTFATGIGSFNVGGLTGSGNISLADGTNPITIVVGGNNSSTTYSGALVGTGGALTKNGTGNLTLGRDNTHTGTTTINAGSIKLNNANSLQNSTVNVADIASPLTFGTGIGTFTLGGLSGNGNLTLSDGSNPITLRVGNNNASTSYGGALVGTNGAVTKIGTGTFTLTRAATYTGATTVSAGTFVLSGLGAINSTSGITLNGGTLLQNSSTALNRSIIFTSGTFGGTGTYTGNLSIGSGHLAPGSGGIGTLTEAGNMTLTSSSILDFDFGTIIGSADLLAFSGAGRSLILDGTLNITCAGLLPGGSYTIFSGASSITNNGLLFGNVPAGHTYSYQIVGGSVIVTAMPEPSTLVFLFMGMSLTLCRGCRFAR